MKMGSKEDNWIRFFYIPDTSLHKKGFTLYKVVSMLYPKNCPDSVTKVTVWKRYNDFKKLYRDIKALHKLLNMKDKFPSFPSTSFFKRFDKEVIQQRKESILQFLEFVAAHSDLFSSDKCVNFFKTSYTPSELLSSNIHSIRAELNLPVEPEYNLIRSNSDDEHALSDTDSVSTLSSTAEQLPDPLLQTSTKSSRIVKKLSEISLPNSSTTSHDSLSICTSLDESTIFENPILKLPSSVSEISMSVTSYITEASQHITQALELENERKYEEAFAAYKAGIDILLKNVKDDSDLDRKDMVRRKTEKYLLRAEKIYNMHLSSESQVIQNYVFESETKQEETIPESKSDLYKYKVIKIIASGMLALHSESQQLFYIKVLNKTVKFSNDKIILPGNVPYMVKLHNYYNCENALVLVLQYCSGCRLSDYIKQKSANSDTFFSLNFFETINDLSLDYVKDEESDCDSDHSYSDLIQNYTINKYGNSNLETSTSDNNLKLDSELYALNHSSELAENHIHKTYSFDLELNKSQLNKEEKVNVIKPRSSRKSSEMSEWSMFDDFSLSENVLLPTHDVVKWTAQLLLCLERLHELGVICCDLQTKNILIEESGNLRLTYMCNVCEKYDVAFSKQYDLALAPEMYSFQPITEAVDWWSFGAILYEMLVGMSLNYIHPEGLTAYTVLKIPKYVSVEGRSLLKQLLAFDPNERLGNGVNGAEDIKLHPFFNSVKWDDLASKWNNF